MSLIHRFCIFRKQPIMTLSIKNMVCQRCIMAVEDILKNMSITPKYIHLGEVEVSEDLNPTQIQELKGKLQEIGFELLDNYQQKLIENIKSLIISSIQNFKEINNYSDFLSSKLNKDYSSLSKLFSATEGITIEHFIILQKIEKVKELITYQEFNLSEISYKLNYSSVAHLSGQFKKITGLTPSQFKNQGIKLRKPLDTI